MLAALLPVLAAAQGYYDASKKPDGDGTARSPYQIATLHNLLWIAQQVNGGIDLADTYLVQTQDIDCSPTRQWDGGHGWAAIGGMQTVNGNCPKKWLIKWVTARWYLLEVTAVAMPRAANSSRRSEMPG